MMKKRLLSLLLAVLMVMTLVPMSALAWRSDSDTDITYAVTGGNIYFNKETGTITGCDTSVTEEVIPSEIDGVAVVSIGDYAFYDCESLTSITIPSSVTSIGSSAFSDCTGLTSINVADENTAYCSVDGVLFDKAVKTLMAYPSGKTDEEYVFPNSVTDVERDAFSEVNYLKSITLPAGLSENCFLMMFDRTFEEGTVRWPNLERINVAHGSSVYSSADGALICRETYGDDTSAKIYYPNQKKDASYSIPNGVTYIAQHAFVNEYITSIYMPASVGYVSTAAFFCENLQDVYYAGTKEQWDAIGLTGKQSSDTTISDVFDDKVTIHYNSVAPVDPVDPVEPVDPVDPVEPVDPVTPTGFSDVASGSYCYDAVQWAVDKGITNGTDATHFSPNAGCTRAQVVTFLWRAAGSPDVSANISFVDVSESSVYYKAIKWAVANGITKGTDATHFSPNATCTRGQVVTFMYRAAGEPAVSGSGSFSDVASGSYCYNAVQWAVAEGITKGTDSTHFSPSDTCTRGQVVTFLYRAQ